MSVLGIDEIHKRLKKQKLVEGLGERELKNPEGVGVVKATSATNWKRCAKHGKNYNADKFSQCWECTKEPAVPTTSDSQATADAF